MLNLENHNSIKIRNNLLNAYLQDIEVQPPSVSVELADRSPLEGIYISLKLEAKSLAAINLIDNLVGRVRGTSHGPVEPLRKALAALIGDLLSALASDPSRYGYRQTGRDTFTRKRIGAGPFNRAADGLAALGYLTIATGRKAPPSVCKGKATRFALTPAFLTYAEPYGIKRENVWDHFGYPAAPLKVKQPIICKGASTKNYALQVKTAGKSIPVDYRSERAKEAASFMQRYNTYIAKHDLSFHHEGFVRIFNNADQAGFDYDEGGRIYAIGGGFQMWSQRSSRLDAPCRSSITIDGHKTAELDFGASHYTIASAYVGLPVDTLNDPYVVTGFPRCIVKSWVNASLGHGKPLAQWPKHLIDEYAAPDKPDKPNRYRRDLFGSAFPYTGALQTDYPINSILKNVSPRFPVLDRLTAMHKNWSFLQYRESRIIVDALTDLMENYDVPALPVHDSLICRSQDRTLVEERMKYWFHVETGLYPRISSK